MTFNQTHSKWSRENVENTEDFTSLAFAPMITNSLGQCGPDLLQFIWNIADHYAQKMLGFSRDENTPRSSSPATHQAANYRKLRSQNYNENGQRILTFIV